MSQIRRATVVLAAITACVLSAYILFLGALRISYWPVDRAEASAFEFVERAIHLLSQGEVPELSEDMDDDSRRAISLLMDTLSPNTRINIRLYDWYTLNAFGYTVTFPDEALESCYLTVIRDSTEEAWKIRYVNIARP